MGRAATEGEVVFVAIEGIDGSGKTTLARKLVDRLNQDRAFVAVHLPAIDERLASGKLIRAVLQDRDVFGPSPGGYAEPVGPAELQGLMTANRLARAERIERDRTQMMLVSDRWTVSGLVYGTLDLPESAGPGVLRERVRWLAAVNQEVPRPDCYIYLALDEETATARMRARMLPAERFEKPDLMRRSIKLYRDVLSNRSLSDALFAPRGYERSPVIEIDARLPLEDVVEQAYLGVTMRR